MQFYKIFFPASLLYLHPTSISMKKFLHISLSILLLTATAGVSVSKHICGGTIYDLAIYHQAETCHSDHDMEMPGCCDDETEQYQVHDDFQGENSLALDHPVNEIPQMAISTIVFLSEQTNQIHSLFETCKSPPCPGTDIVIKAQAFLL